MRQTFPLFPAGTRSAGPSCNTTHIAGRSRHLALPARIACLLGLVLLAGSANASSTDNAIDCAALRAEAKQARAQRDFDRFHTLWDSPALMKCNGEQFVPPN